MMSNMHQMWMQLSSFIFILQFINQFVPQTVYIYVAFLQSRISKLTDPYIDISINEIVTTYSSSINRAYELVEAYLNPKSFKSAKRIKCQLPQEGKKLIFSMDDYEEIVDEFRGIKIWWYLHKKDVKHHFATERRQLRLKLLNPTPLPTPLPTLLPTPSPTPLPTHLPTPLPTPLPTTYLLLYLLPYLLPYLLTFVINIFTSYCKELLSNIILLMNLKLLVS
ncbi:hypothetical protein MKX03_024270 [Papaver bracteatum]|nr:hypothetical protein MKX03_024270 [Papaver bracteatum]